MIFDSLPNLLFIRTCQLDASAGSPVTYLMINFSICSSCHLVNGKLSLIVRLNYFVSRKSIYIYNTKGYVIRPSHITIVKD
jgi:hypothetical protein